MQSSAPNTFTMLRAAFLTLGLVAAANAACKDLDETQCGSDQSCVVGYPFSCRDKGCFDTWDESECKANSKCVYAVVPGQGYSQCFAKPDDKPCDDPSHANGMCPQKCTFSYDDGSCRET